MFIKSLDAETLKALPPLETIPAQTDNIKAYVKITIPVKNWIIYLAAFDGKETFYGLLKEDDYIEYGRINGSHLTMLECIAMYKILKDTNFMPKRLSECIEE